MFGQTHLQHRLRSKAPERPAATAGSAAASEETDTATDHNTSAHTANSHSIPKPVIGTYAIGQGPTRNDRERTASMNTVNTINTVSSEPESLGLSRTSSVYTLGRSSFAAQLNQLTSVDLPEPSTLSATVSAIPTAQEACRTLSTAAPQIRHWINTAAKVLGSLDAEDDIEWASNGKESVAEVDAAIHKFASLVNIYVNAIEQLQKRDDVDTVPAQQVKDVVANLEDVLTPWSQVQKSLAATKSQVELAQEWEAIWNTDMGSISNELTDLSRLVFKMEEERHNQSQEHEDIFESVPLQTIAEDMPDEPRTISRDVSPAAPRVAIDIHSPKIKDASEDTGLVALFAQMQPVKTSLEFLPIKLASFRTRAEKMFPSAVEELSQKADSLGERWAKLEWEAETLRAELNEDRWVSIFRNAGRQASKMCQSLERGIVKLQESLDISSSTNTPDSGLNKKIADYTAKKSSFAPAITKILSVIDKGIEERKTVNGEVLKIQQDIRRVWSALEADMTDMDAALESRAGAQLRDSVSTIGTQETTFDNSYATPGTSPASSVIAHKQHDTAALGSRSAGSALPVRSRYLNPRSVSAATPSTTPRAPSRANRLGSQSTPHSAPPDNRPRWTGSTVVDYSKFGPHKRPESRLHRSPWSTTSSMASSVPPSPLTREATASPSPSTGSLAVPRARGAVRRPQSSLARERHTASPSPARSIEARARQHHPGALMQQRMNNSVNGRRAVTVGPLQNIPKEDSISELSLNSPPLPRSASRVTRNRASMMPAASKENDKPRWRP